MNKMVAVCGEALNREVKALRLFSLQLLSKIFPILRIQRDIAINVKTPSCKVLAIRVGF
jgi:hypothetical protein